MAVVAAGAGAYSYRAHRLRARVAQWKVDGLAAARHGDAALAVERLTSYLSYDPSDREALLAYADARPLIESSDGRNWVETARALRYLVQLDPANVACRVRLLELYWKLGLRTESVDAAREIVARDPGNGRALDIESAALASLKSYGKSLEVARRWCEVDPNNLAAQCRTFGLRVMLGQPVGDALADVDAWGKRHTDDPARYELLKACAYATFADRDNALVWLRRAAKRPPPDDSFADLLIDRFAELGDGTEDITVLKDLTARGAGQRVRDRLLERLWELNRYGEVIDLAKTMDLGDPATPVPVLAVASLAYAGSGHAAGSVPLREMLRRRCGAVAVAWTTILDSSGDQPSAHRAVVAACGRALSSDWRSPYLRYFLGESLAALGENQLAIEAWQQEGAVSPAWGLPLARMAELLLDQGDASRAARIATVALKRNPTPATGLVVARIAVIMMQQGQSVKPDVVLNLIAQLEKLMPGDGRIRLLRAQMLAATGKRDDAIGLVRELLQQPPAPRGADEGLLRQAAAVSRAAGLGVEQDLWARAGQLYGMSPALAFERSAAAAAASDDPNEALTMFDRARGQSAPKTGENQSLAWELERARLLDVIASPDGAAAWRAIGNGNANNLPVQRAVLAARAIRADRAFREQTIARLAALVGDDSLVCSLARAEVLIENRCGEADDRAIAEMLKRIIAVHPALPEPRVLWAAYLEQTGRIDEAIDQTQIAANANPDLPSLALTLARLYRDKGDFGRARSYAGRVADSKRSTPAEVRLAAEMLADLGDGAKATVAIERLLAENRLGSGASNADDLALARLYWQQGKIERADGLVSRMLASATAAKQPGLLAFSARFYASQKRSNEMAGVLRIIDALKLPVEGKELIHADVLAAAGDLAGAERVYHQAVSASPKDPDTWRALIAFLYGLGRAGDATSAIDQALAQVGTNPPLAELKRSADALAVACRLDEMRSILRDYLQDPLKRTAAREILVAVARASTDSAAERVSDARTLSQQYTGVESVQLWAIRTYLRSGRLADAASAIARVTSDFPESSTAAAVATAFYSSQSNWPRMLDVAQQWRNRVRGPATGDEMERADTSLARALLEVRRASEALDLLAPLVATCRKNPWGHVALLITYADCLQAMGRAGEAADLLPLAAKDRPWRQACIKFAAETLDKEIARSWLEALEPWARAGSLDELSEVADAWAVLFGRSGESAYASRAEGLFREIEQSPLATATAIRRAGVLAERFGDTGKAISLYRRAIAMNPNEPVAMNNLAVLLANRGLSGDGDEAARCAAAVLKAHPDEPELLDTLAFVKAKGGDFPAAVRAMSTAVELDPENARWRVVLAQLLADSGQKTQAARVLAGIETMGDNRDRLAPRFQDQLRALRVQLNPKPDPATTKPAITALMPSN